jgi:hypothetical protein
MVQIIDNPLQLNPAQSAQMGAGLVAPVAGALNTYVDRQHEAQVAQTQAGYAERLQQLKLDAVARNVAARDAMLLQRAREADAAREAAASTNEKARSDAALQQGLNSALKAQQERAAKYGTPEPEWKGTGPNGAVTPQDMVKHINDWTAANDARLNDPDKGLIATTAKNITSYLHEQDNVTDQIGQYVSKNGKQAVAMAVNDPRNSPDAWMAASQPANSKQVADYNAAIANGSSVGAALAQSGLGGQYQQYISSVAPKYAAALLKENAATDPVAKDLLGRATRNAIMLQQVVQDKHGQPLDYAQDAQHLALSNYAADKAAPVKDLHDKVVAGGGQSNDPAVIAAAAAANNKILDKQKQLGITIGGSAGGSDIDTSKPVVAPAINPLDALKTPGGLPAPSGDGVFHLDKNNQLQFTPHPVESSIPFVNATPRPIAPQDAAWIKQVSQSHLFNNLVAPNDAPAPVINGAPAASLTIPPPAAATPPAAAPAAAPVTPMQMFTLPPVPAAVSGGGGSDYAAQVSSLLGNNSSPWNPLNQ